VTDLQLYILVAIPLVGILSNTALFIHLGQRIGSLENKMDTRFDLVMGKLADLDTRVSVLEDRVIRGGK
jgi:hypothetical protein